MEKIISGSDTMSETSSTTNEALNEFRHYLRTGEQRNLVSNTSSGSYLVPEEFHNEVLSAAFERNFVAQLSRKIRTNTTRNVPVVTAAGTAAIVGENTAYTASDPTITEVVLYAYKDTFKTIVSEELLSDAGYNVEAELAKSFGIAFGAAEEAYYLVGTGSNQPTGVCQQAAAMSGVSVSAAPTKAQLITAVYGIARQYRDGACWVMNDSTAALIAGLKEDVTSSGSTPYWWTDARAGEPATLLGFPVYTSSAMAAVGSDAKCVVFGNFNYYLTAERGPMEIKVLDGMVEYGSVVAASHRIDGKPMTTSAFYVMQCANS